MLDQDNFYLWISKGEVTCLSLVGDKRLNPNSYPQLRQIWDFSKFLLLPTRLRIESYDRLFQIGQF